MSRAMPQLGLWLQQLYDVCVQFSKSLKARSHCLKWLMTKWLLKERVFTKMRDWLLCLLRSHDVGLHHIDKRRILRLCSTLNTGEGLCNITQRCSRRGLYLLCGLGKKHMCVCMWVGQVSPNFWPYSLPLKETWNLLVCWSLCTWMLQRPKLQYINSPQALSAHFYLGSLC